MCSHPILDRAGSCPQGAGSAAWSGHRMGQGQRLQRRIYNTRWKGGCFLSLHIFAVFLYVIYHVICYCVLIRSCLRIYVMCAFHIITLEMKASLFVPLYFRWISGQSLAMRCSKRWVTEQNLIFCKQKQQTKKHPQRGKITKSRRQTMWPDSHLCVSSSTQNLLLL